MRFKSLAAAALLGASALGVSGCATGFPAQVSRLQAMPAPQGQTFFVVPENPAQQGTLEFNNFAAQVAQAMQANGYQAAANPQSATMLVRMAYGVDEGQDEIVRDPFYNPYGGYGGYGGYGRYGGYPGYGRYGAYPGYGRYGYPGYGTGGYGAYYPRTYGYYGSASPYSYGWNSPYWGGLDSRTVFKSYLDLDIRRRADNIQLFDGHAKARSGSDDLNRIVPNLVAAMFTGFPGRSGETVRITVPPAKKN